MTKNNSNFPIIDWSFGKQLNLTSPGLMEELLELFMKQLPDMQTAINQAFRDNNLADLDEHLHKFHGSCVYCGLMRLRNAVAKCSSVVKQHKLPEQTMLDEINNEVEAVKKELKKQPPSV